MRRSLWIHRLGIASVPRRLFQEYHQHPSDHLQKVWPCITRGTRQTSIQNPPIQSQFELHDEKSHQEENRRQMQETHQVPLLQGSQRFREENDIGEGRRRKFCSEDSPRKK